MTRDNIEDYLYFFWAPLLKAEAIAPDEIDLFQKMVILTLSQASVYIEAPTYKAGSSSRDFSGVDMQVNNFIDLENLRILRTSRLYKIADSCPV
jgi:hypothetical protein